MRIGVLVSGRGSNLESILKSIQKGAIKGAQVSVVISNRAEARALRIAREYGAKAVTVSQGSASSEEFGSALSVALRKHGVSPREGLVLLAGFMKVLPRSFVELYRGRIMNIHPSLLPAFPGLNAQRQALEHGVKVSGCTVHFVVPEVDAGPIIIQKAVAVKEGDDEGSLSSRILRQEHRIYPEAVRLFVQGRLRIVGRGVLVKR
ncbi:MAG: phosphoribosylglycinamide formyltransferase [Nitrososphaerales archaeon]|nr:phosphoribosylglycinamide formyltransferase [Nitrososphaerales archaeon]